MTIGTRLFTWLKGKCVGEDAFGNRYFQERGAGTRRRRRWVLYKGEPEASKVPPEWHGWLHRIVDTPPSETTAKPHSWQKPHLPNLTGTAHAYSPPGDMVKGDRPEGMPAPYQPWRP